MPESVLGEWDWDLFGPDPGTVDVMHCKVCYTQCLVKREAELKAIWDSDPKNEEMTRCGMPKRRPHDRFYCPHTKEPWHDQVLALRLEVRKTPSQFLANILQEEIGFILSQKKPTKDPYLTKHQEQAYDRERSVSPTIVFRK